MSRFVQAVWSGRRRTGARDAGETMLARILGTAPNPALGVPLVAALVAAAELTPAHRHYGVFTRGFGPTRAGATPRAPGERCVTMRAESERACISLRKACSMPGRSPFTATS